MVDQYPEAEVGEAVWELLVLQVKASQTAGITKGEFVMLDDVAGIQPLTGQTATAGAPIFGVALETIAQNAKGNVLVIGLVKMTTGGAVAAGAKVKSDTSGLPITATTGDELGGIAAQKIGSGETGLILVLPSLGVA